MDRDSIFQNFQAISQIQDFEECIQILESVNWDLNSALNSVEHLNDYAVPIAESQVDINYDSISNSSVSVGNRELIFHVDIRGQTIQVLINENKTVGDLANMVAQQIHEPQSKFKINGLKMPYYSNTPLKNLKLQRESHVVANPVESSFSYVASSSTQKQSAIKEYHLSIEVHINDKFSQILEFPFNGKDSVGKVKMYIATLLGTTVSRQTWTGWPVLPNGEETTLQNCGLSKNTFLKINVDVDQKTLKTPRLKPECYKSSTEASFNNSRIDETENDEDDDYYDDPGDVELAEETEWPLRRSLPLMPQDAHNDAMTATFHFNNEFILRYCSDDSGETLKPPFFIGTLDDALSNTLNLLPKKRKPLFLYLHHEDSIQANIFCTQVLCYSNIVLYFTQSDLMIWPWDITYAENKSQLLTWLLRSFGSQVVSQIRAISKDQFPVIVALGKSQGNIELLEILDGSKMKDEILIHLWNIKSQFEDKQEVDILAWEELELRKRVKMEQDEAYQESLTKDQIKEKELEDQILKIKEDEKNKMLQIQKTEKQRQLRIEEALLLVPLEPEDGPDTVTIRLKLPPNYDFPLSSGLTRRFLYSHTLAHLIAYIESIGFLRTEFKLLMTYPRTNLTQIDDQNITLKNLGIPKRENLILERI